MFVLKWPPRLHCICWPSCGVDYYHLSYITWHLANNYMSFICTVLLYSMRSCNNVTKMFEFEKEILKSLNDLFLYFHYNFAHIMTTSNLEFRNRTWADEIFSQITILNLQCFSLLNVCQRGAMLPTTYCNHDGVGWVTEPELIISK